jgi:peptidoglycan/xylan/chitin deacetylase (PgdA/CDA1 family)
MRLSHGLARHFPAARHVMRNPAPLVSITFDDVPETAWQVGAPMIEARGWRGTFYIATSLFGQKSPHWQVAGTEAVTDLDRRGHEVGLHSHYHRPAWGINAGAFAQEIALTKRVFAELAPGLRPTNFAYPYGIAGVVQKAVLARSVRSSRTADNGVNAGTIDPHFLRTVMLDWSRRAPSDLDAVLAETVRQNGWLILTTHDVSDTPSPYGCTPALFSAVLDKIAAAGIEVATVDDALDRIGLVHC